MEAKKYLVLDKPFRLAFQTVCRSDLVEDEILTEDEAMKLSDKDMEFIAHRMGNSLIDDSWHEVLRESFEVLKK